ncbi:hypothetical protein CBR_g10797 [Chara braunii]|uniref:Peroxisomal membrane protein PEX14-like KPWE domain-containing protein n=1 Tax=Chara braunii TaxID=69332 RepID=A0A388KP78_CHABU|nr:hypothetical protein CBR_g10797 [Chara braunii]|eukprot:GBG71859.1 hypothetical protein CBR_g10797 [Chara braunii]
MGEEKRWTEGKEEGQEEEDEWERRHGRRGRGGHEEREDTRKGRRRGGMEDEEVRGGGGDKEDEEGQEEEDKQEEEEEETKRRREEETWRTRKGRKSKVMEMLAKGQKPPGIKDIDDKPPNVDQPLSSPRMTPLPKASCSTVPNISSSAASGVTEERIPWWRQNPKVSASASSAPTAPAPSTTGSTARAAVAPSSVAPYPRHSPSISAAFGKRQILPSRQPSSPPANPQPATVERRPPGNLPGGPRPAAVHPSSPITLPQASTPTLHIKGVAVDRMLNEVQSSGMEPTRHGMKMADHSGVASHPSSTTIADCSSSASEEIAVAFDRKLHAHGKEAMLLETQDVMLPKGVAPSASVAEGLEPMSRSTWSAAVPQKTVLQSALAALGYEISIREQRTPATEEEDIRGKGEAVCTELAMNMNGQYSSSDSSDGHPSVRGVVATRSAGRKDLLTEIEI